MNARENPGNERALKDAEMQEKRSGSESRNPKP